MCPSIWTAIKWTKIPCFVIKSLFNLETEPSCDFNGIEFSVSSKLLVVCVGNVKMEAVSKHQLDLHETLTEAQQTELTARKKTYKIPTVKVNSYKIHIHIYKY